MSIAKRLHAMVRHQARFGTKGPAEAMAVALALQPREAATAFPPPAPAPTPPPTPPPPPSPPPAPIPAPAPAARKPEWGPYPLPSKAGQGYRVHRDCGGRGCPACRETGWETMGKAAIEARFGPLPKDPEPKRRNKPSTNPQLSFDW